MHQLYRVLMDTAKKVKPKSYLEVGVREGHSLLSVLLGHVPEKIELVDNWGLHSGGTGANDRERIRQTIEMLGVDEVTAIHSGNSEEVLPLLTGPFDMALVDGDHSYWGAKADLRLCWRLLGSGGVLVMDDLHHNRHPYLRVVFLEFSYSVSDQVKETELFDEWPGVGRLWKK